MARAFARGLGEPADFADGGSGRSRELATEFGGVPATVQELAARADAIVLAHKPKQLTDVAAELSGYSGLIVSLLAATTLEQLRAAYPSARVVRTMPNIPIEHGVGVLGVAQESDAAPELQHLLERFGTVVTVPERDFETFTAVAGCAPAFFALFAERLIASAAERGLDAATAAQIVNQTMLGTAISLRESGVDTAELQRRVASPGGLTARALKSFEETGLAASVDAAVATVLGQ